jgi:hypothetical protein
MKLTDLNFRILTPTPERARKLLDALTRAGVSYSTQLKPERAQAISLRNGHFSFWRFPGVDGFDNDPLPELTFTEALELLAQVEAPTPTFDIKLRDEVLCRHSPIFEWNFKIFTRVTEDYFSTTGHVYEQLIPFKGNEHLHGETTTPDGWWEVESGQPVWRCK